MLDVHDQLSPEHVRSDKRVQWIQVWVEKRLKGKWCAEDLFSQSEPPRDQSLQGILDVNDG